MIPGAIHFQTPLAAGVATGEPSRSIYFSFETLTTVSYGDAYPVHRIAGCDARTDDCDARSRTMHANTYCHPWPNQVI